MMDRRTDSKPFVNLVFHFKARNPEKQYVMSVSDRYLNDIIDRQTDTKESLCGFCFQIQGTELFYLP